MINNYSKKITQIKINNCLKKCLLQEYFCQTKNPQLININWAIIILDIADFLLKIIDK